MTLYKDDYTARWLLFWDKKDNKIYPMTVVLTPNPFHLNDYGCVEIFISNKQIKEISNACELSDWLLPGIDGHTPIDAIVDLHLTAQEADESFIEDYSEDGYSKLKPTDHFFKWNNMKVVNVDDAIVSDSWDIEGKVITFQQVITKKKETKEIKLNRKLL
jgi:hypothetical protein